MARRDLLEWWANVQLRNKITGVTVLMLLFGLIFAGVGTFSLLRPTLVAAQDAELKQLRVDPGPALGPDSDPNSLTRQDVVTAPTTYYVALLDASGNTVYDNYADQSDDAPQIPQVTPGWAAANQENILVFETVEGTDWRGVAVPIFSTATGQGSGTLIIASSTAMINAVVAQYATIFTGFVLAVVILGAAITRILISATLEPLAEVQRTAKAISDGDFGQRIQVDAPNTEVGEVGRSLNVMLDRMDDAITERAQTVDRMRRFIGDAGHELRTPLVTLRGYAELYRMGGLQDDEQLAHAMTRVEGEAIRMTSLVEDLLALARLEEDRSLNFTPLDLNAFANDAAMDASVQDPHREIRAVLDPRQPLAMGDEHKVRQLMTNLIGNAFKHTEPGTPIEIVVEHAGEKAVFEVRDHGEGVPEEIRGKIFDRFWRADNSRNRETGGSGLGLAIVASIVAAHKGTVTVLETEGGGATFRVELPCTNSEAVAQEGVVDTGFVSLPATQPAPAKKRRSLLPKLRMPRGRGRSGQQPEKGSADPAGDAAAPEDPKPYGGA